MKTLPVVIIKILVFLIVFATLPTYATDQQRQATQEIEQLLHFIKESPCRFNRNGTWYSTLEAVDHIKRKYQYSKDRGMVQTTEDFISHAATKSSISGRRYMVKCSHSKEEPSADWLLLALKRIRAQK